MSDSLTPMFFSPRPSSPLGRVGLGIIVLHLGESAQRKQPSGYGKTVCDGWTIEIDVVPICSW